MDTLMRALPLFDDDFELLHVCMSIHVSRDKREDIHRGYHLIIASSPYRLFPGETKPITKLLGQ